MTGQETMEECRAELLRLLRERAYERRPVTLASGRTSDYYIDGKQVTLSPDGLRLLATIILESLKNESVEAIGGPTLGADPIAGAVAALSYGSGRPISAFIVRKEPKGHGMQKMIEGPALKPGAPVVIVEDVVTTGGSVLRAIEAVEDAGYRVARVIALVDREEGAREELRRRGYRYDPIFTRADLEASSDHG